MHGGQAPRATSHIVREVEHRVSGAGGECEAARRQEEPVDIGRWGRTSYVTASFPCWEEIVRLCVRSRVDHSTSLHRLGENREALRALRGSARSRGDHAARTSPRASSAPGASRCSTSAAPCRTGPGTRPSRAPRAAPTSDPHACPRSNPRKCPPCCWPGVVGRRREESGRLLLAHERGESDAAAAPHRGLTRAVRDTAGPSDPIALRNASSFSAFLRNRATSVFSVGSMSFGHPPSPCDMVIVTFRTTSVLTVCSESSVAVSNSMVRGFCGT